MDLPHGKFCSKNPTVRGFLFLSSLGTREMFGNILLYSSPEEAKQAVHRPPLCFMVLTNVCLSPGSVVASSGGCSSTTVVFCCLSAQHPFVPTVENLIGPECSCVVYTTSVCFWALLFRVSITLKKPMLRKIPVMLTCFVMYSCIFAFIQLIGFPSFFLFLISIVVY